MQSSGTHSGFLRPVELQSLDVAVCSGRMESFQSWHQWKFLGHRRHVLEGGVACHTPPLPVSVTSCPKVINSPTLHPVDCVVSA